MACALGKWRPGAETGAAFAKITLVSAGPWYLMMAPFFAS